MREHKIKILSFSRLLLISTFILAIPNAHSSSLDSWFKYSWDYSPEIKSSEASVKLVEANSLAASSDFMPSLFARYQYRENEQSRQTKVFSLNAEQNLFNGFGDFYSKKSNSKLLEAERSALEYKKMSLARIVGDTLLKLASTTTQMSILDENAKILDKRLVEFKRRTRIGKSRDVDLIQNQIDRIQLERQKATNKRNLLSALATLKEYTGKDIQESPFSMGQLLKELDAYHSSLTKESFRRTELRHRLEAKEFSVQSKYSTYWPTLKGVASYYPENDSRFSQYTDDWSVGVDLEWRFFEGFAGKAQLNQEKALRQLAESELQRFENDNIESTQRLKDEWAQLLAERKLVAEAERLSVKSFKAQERDFRLGLVTVLELSNSDEQYLNLKLEKISIQEKLGLILTQALESGGIEGLRL
ncbi:MAG: TolC family protein [Bdellovibrionota bacterium]